MQNCPFWSVLAEFWVRLQNRNLEFFFWRPSLQTVDSILKSFVACGRAKDWNMFSYCRNYWSHLLSSVLMLLCTHQEYVQAWQDASGTMAGEKFHAWYAVPEGGEAEAVQLPRFLNLPLEVGVAQWLKTKEAWDCKVASLAMEGKVLAPKAKTLHAACLNWIFWTFPTFLTIFWATTYEMTGRILATSGLDWGSKTFGALL